jgi:DUF1365 family protein
MPRVLGYVFNPLSVYFCSDESGQLRAILYEVHNTFGERHTYVFPMDGAVSAAAEHATPKAFHVSPFLAMDMAYRFRTHPPDDAVAVAISGEDATGPVIFASLSGRREPLSDRALLGLLAGFPLVTLRVIAAIHWHAFRMILKGFRIHRHPRKSPKVAVP